MNNKTTTLAGIIAMPASENSWVDGSFKCIVTRTKEPSGKMPGKATLVDPDDGSITLDCSFFRRDPSPYEGSIVIFSGPGIKKGEYKGTPQVSVGEKTRVEIFQNLNTSAPARSAAAPVAASALAATKAPDFNAEMGRMQLLYVHSYRSAMNVSELVKTLYQVDFTPEQMQSCVASMFIEANRKNLGAHVPELAK